MYYEIRCYYCDVTVWNKTGPFKKQLLATYPPKSGRVVRRKRNETLLLTTFIHPTGLSPSIAGT